VAEAIACFGGGDPKSPLGSPAFNSVEPFKQGARMWQTDDGQRYGEMCRNRRNRLCCKTRFNL